MKKITAFLLLYMLFQGVYSQTIIINHTFVSDTIIYPFSGNELKYGLNLSGLITLNSDSSVVRVILSDNYNNQYLIYESYTLIDTLTSIRKNNMCDETCLLKGLVPASIMIEIKSASLHIDSVYLKTTPDQDYDNDVAKIKAQILNQKIYNLNKQLAKKKMLWRAGKTTWTNLSFEQRKTEFVENTYGYEFYQYGIFHLPYGIENIIKSQNSNYVDRFDWRNRHNANDSLSPYWDGNPDYYHGWPPPAPDSSDYHEKGNGWMTHCLNQTLWWYCQNTCYIYAPVGALEALINLYYNKHLDLDLSEQQMVSCANAGGCGGGYSGEVLDYYRTHGIIDEACFPRGDQSNVPLPCSDTCNSPQYKIKTNGYIDYGTLYYNGYGSNIDSIKKALIKEGPLHFATASIPWAHGHSMVLVGFGVVRAGLRLAIGYNQWDTTHLIVQDGNPYIGSIYWICKNSAGPIYGEGGYGYIIPQMNSNFQMSQIFAVKTPIIEIGRSDTIRCVDLDGDGYYNWGIGPKPSTCPTCPSQEDGNDADPMMGPYDVNYYCTCNCSYIPPFPNPPIEITQNTEWNDYKYLNKDVIVHSGDTLIISAQIGFRKNKGIKVQSGGTLILNDGSYLYSICDTTWSGITVEGGGTLITNNNSIIALSGDGKIFIDSSSHGAGKFYYNKGSYLSLADDSTYIDIKGNLYIGDSANFTFTGDGYVRFSSTLNPSKNIFYGSGSSITLTGSGQSDKIMEIAQETVFMPNCTLSNGLVYMQHPNARMQAASENTSMFLDNVKFSPLGTTRTQHRGVNVWGNQNCTISNCIFENGQYGIYAYLSYGGTSLSVSNCNFTNNTYGMWVHDKSFNSSTCTFTKNDYGIYAENTSVNNSKIDNCYFTGNPNRNKYPIRYMNCDGGLSIENTQIYDADATSLYSINSSGNYNVRLYCTTVSVPGTNTYALNLANGASLTMSTNTSRSGNCNIIAAAPIRLTNAYNINIDNGYNYLNKSGGYHVYGNITAYPCSGMPPLYFRNNQWNGTITNLVKNNNCSPVQNFTLVTSPTAIYTSCSTNSLVVENNQTTENSTQIMDHAEDTQEWQSAFNENAQAFNGNLPEGNLHNIKFMEDSWENMRYCLKKMYGLKQLNGISNSEFNQTILANHKMQQLQKDNYYRLFQLKLEKVTLYRMAGDYDKAIELVEKLTSDTCSSHKEQADAWLCMLQLEKRIAQGLIPPDRIEKERVNCPMFQEPVDEQIKSFQNNSSEINSESSSWIKIVPNPASEQVTLCVNSESENPCEIEITNVLGEHVETISIAEGYSETVVSLDKYSKGIYIASLIKNGRKVIIERFSVVK